MSEADDPAILLTDRLNRWQLTPDGKPTATPTSRRLPVHQGRSVRLMRVTIGSQARFSAAG
jgi:streptomycin 6-kinase